MEKNNRSRLQMIGAMAIFGTIAPFTRAVGISSGEISLWRAILAFLFVGIFMLIAKKPLRLQGAKEALFLLLLSGGAMGINWILLFESYKYTTASSAVLCYYFAPVIVTVVSSLLFRERLTPKQILCFIGATAGLVLMTLSGDLSGSNLIGIFLALGAAVFYATVILLNKFLKTVEGLDRTLLQFISAIVVLLPYVLLTGGFQVGSLDTRGYIALLILGLFHTGFAYCLYFSALKNLPGQKAALLSYIDPLVAILISVVILREAMTPLQALGGAMVLGFTLWNEL